MCNTRLKTCAAHALFTKHVLHMFSIHTFSILPFSIQSPKIHVFKTHVFTFSCVTHVFKTVPAPDPWYHRELDPGVNLDQINPRTRPIYQKETLSKLIQDRKVIYIKINKQTRILTNLLGIEPKVRIPHVADSTGILVGLRIPVKSTGVCTIIKMYMPRYKLYNP